ncbi:hypothetical protein [Parapedobacter sp. 2B3]|uniref:lipase family protein n=1 Tax=Parapedobacter sp. 2B3 TaxID=3342381 RepID=UPI0035B5C2E4
MAISTHSLIALMLFVNSIYGQPARDDTFEPGFNPQESDELLALNFAFLDTNRNARFDTFLPGYRFLYRSESIGLDNAWDLWIRSDSTVTIVVRGTTANPKSILADFLCAMSPAQGTLILAPGDTLAYRLAAHEKAAVHTGFLIGFGYLAYDMRPKVDSLYAAGYRNFLVTGHSQGGALSYYTSAWLHYLEKDNIYRGIRVKTYASASPKLSNMYFAYDFDNVTRAEWAFSLTNSADVVPEMPFTTQQVDVDMNEPNPILRLMDRFDSLPFFQRLVMKRAFNRMRKGAAKSSLAYQKYLGGYTAKLIAEMVPGLELPHTINSTYFVRPGVPISLVVDDEYMNHFAPLAKEGPYYHHNPITYRYLLRKYYDGLPALAEHINIR